jgi:lysophospholipase L1-like esterase
MTSPGRRAEAKLLPVIVSLCLALFPWERAAAGTHATQVDFETRHFFSALRGLEDGRRDTVTILYLGDSHIAADGIAGQLRARLAARFGGGQAGMMMPGLGHPYYQVADVDIEMNGAWRVVSGHSMKAGGVFGLSGFRLETEDAAAGVILSLRQKHDLAALDLWLAGTGNSGLIDLYVNEQWLAVFAVGPHRHFRHMRVDLPPNGKAIQRLHLKSAPGSQKIALLSVLLTFQEEKGIRLTAFGVPSARAEILGRLDELVVASELASLRPDLIILGYGTNEAFDDAAIGGYEDDLEFVIQRLKRLAPGSDILLLGAPAAQRLSDFGAESKSDRPSCPSSSSDEDDTAHVKLKDDISARWHIPPALEFIRTTQQKAAREMGVAFFDLGAVMGGSCAMHEWVSATPPRAWPDHVHFKPPGQDILAEALFDFLMRGYSRFQSDKSEIKPSSLTMLTGQP